MGGTSGPVEYVHGVGHGLWGQNDRGAPLVSRSVKLRRMARAGSGEASGSTHPQACLATRVKAWNECSNTIEQESTNMR